MWTWPINPCIVTDEFGNRFHPIDRVWRLHAGIDLAAETGQGVFAAGDGTIVHAGYNGGEGNSVHVQHDEGSKTKYFHGVSITQYSGRVEAGRSQVIGAGTTGASTGTHLHFECHANSSYSPVNPREFMAARGVPFGGKSAVTPVEQIQKVDDDDMKPVLIFHRIRNESGQVVNQQFYAVTPITPPLLMSDPAVRERYFRPWGGVPAPTIMNEGEFDTLKEQIVLNIHNFKAA